MPRLPAITHHHEAARKYRNGATLRQLAAEYGCCVPAVRFALTKAGVSIRPRGPRTKAMRAVAERYAPPAPTTTQDPEGTPPNPTPDTVSPDPVKDPAYQPQSEGTDPDPPSAPEPAPKKKPPPPPLRKRRVLSMEEQAIVMLEEGLLIREAP